MAEHIQPRQPGARVQREALEQEALYRWRDLCVRGGAYPGLDLLFAIPNGAYLHGTAASRAAQWARLRRAGARSGVADNFLPVPRDNWHGLWIELKAARPHAAAVSAEQREWIARMQAQGFAAHVAYGWQAAVDVINDYYGIEHGDKHTTQYSPGPRRERGAVPG